MTVQIKIIESFDSFYFEQQVNVFLKEWSYRIVTYNMGRSIIGIRRKWGKETNLFRYEALFVIDDSLSEDGQKRLTKPNLSMNSNEDKSAIKAGSGIL